jgi:hypothetical protein
MSINKEQLAMNKGMIAHEKETGLLKTRTPVIQAVMQ